MQEKEKVEIVQKAVDFITDFNAQCKKPVITPRNRFFQLPEMARQARLKLQEIRERENRELKFEGGTLVWNYEADRLQILFDSIPDDQKRKELKSYGFKWSPRYQAWQRQLTQNAVYAVKQKSVEPSKPIKHERPIEICSRFPLLRRDMPDQHE